MKVMAIGAHPDDLEISCAGTLAKLKQSGHEVVLCHASDGDKGHYEIPPAELIGIRKREAQLAGAVIGCEVLSLGMRDGEILADSKETRLLFAEAIRSVQPDIIITHAPNDYMPDHTAVNKLVFDTSFLATLPAFTSPYPGTMKVPALYYMDNLSGIDFQPTIYVDISETMDTKLRMLDCHESQVVWLKAHDGIDLPEFVQTLGRMRGIQAGCKYAEGFIQHMAWTRPNAVRFPV
jgi:N-acetylglucosamine malate deacetylase 1